MGSRYVEWAEISFRPLTGSKVSEQITDAEEKELKRFRPLAGSKASELVGFNTMTSGITCFRPLSGIKVSERLIARVNAWSFEFSSHRGD